MTKITAGAAKAKTAKYANSRSGQPTPEIAKSDPPNVKTPEAPREIAGNGGAGANTAYEKAKAGFEQAMDLHKSTYTTAAKGAGDYNLKVLEIARINAGAAFDYTQELLGVKSLPELIELSTAHARKQFEAMAAQTKELTELAAKVTTEITEPLKAGVTKAFNTQAA
jgi:phasin